MFVWSVIDSSWSIEGSRLSSNLLLAGLLMLSSIAAKTVHSSLAVVLLSSLHPRPR